MHWNTWNSCYLSNLSENFFVGGFIYFLTAVEFLQDHRNVFEDKMRILQRQGKWKWILMKESPDRYYKDYQALVYAFKVLK